MPSWRSAPPTSPAPAGYLECQGLSFPAVPLTAAPPPPGFRSPAAERLGRRQTAPLRWRAWPHPLQMLMGPGRLRFDLARPGQAWSGLAGLLMLLAAQSPAAANPTTTPGTQQPATPNTATQTPSAGAAQATAPSQRRLVLDRRRRRLLLLEGGRELRRFPVAVGRPGWETPVGEFVVFERVRNPRWQHPATGQVVPPGPANPLGSRWIGFHRDCRGRRGFNGRQQLVVEGCVTAGFHGTPQRESVGRAISHGCVRLYDEHVRELYELVPLGTPLTVLP